MRIEDFGRHLLRTGDLDPVYLMLYAGRLPRPLLERWLLAYWCFYSVGAASYLADFPDFWSKVKTAAENVEPAPHGGRWERGHERRHFRGAKAVRAVQKLEAQYGHDPGLFIRLASAQPATCSSVMRFVEGHYLFGPWIGFKAADMLERVLGIPVSFSGAEVFVFDAPAEAAETLWKVEGAYSDISDRPTVVHWAVSRLLNEFHGYSAPPRYDRPLGLQEVETILCKWKSHQNGKYPLNHDIVEVRESLARWAPYSPLAKSLLEVAPCVG